MHVRVASVSGNVAFSETIAQLKAAPHVVVGTPGRVCDMIRRGAFGLTLLLHVFLFCYFLIERIPATAFPTDLQHLKTLVCDEADELTGRGFQVEVMGVLTAIPKGTQLVFASSSIPDDLNQVNAGNRDSFVLVFYRSSGLLSIAS